MSEIAPERGTVAPGMSEAVLAGFTTIALLAMGGLNYWIMCLVLAPALGLLYSKDRDTRFDFGIYAKTTSFAYIGLAFVSIISVVGA